MAQKFLDKAFLESKGRKGIVRNQQRRIGRRERERERRGNKFRERERERGERVCVCLSVCRCEIQFYDPVCADKNLQRLQQ